MKTLGKLVAFYWGLHVTVPAPAQTLPWDGIPYEFWSDRVDAIGDIHGDADALGKILHNQRVIDRGGKWRMGNRHLVFTGDLIDRGSNSRLVMDTTMRLEFEAEAQGGAVHSLIGNHELMVVQGDYRFLTPADIASFGDFASSASAKVVADQLSGDTIGQNIEGLPAALAAFREGPYADFIARRNSIVIVRSPKQSVLFVHAGIGPWLLRFDVGEINATMRAWIRFYQGRGPEPEVSTRWVIGDGQNGDPIWDRNLARGRVRPDFLQRVKERLGVDYIVIGHSPTDSSRIEQLYEGSVFNIDTGISAYYEGSLSMLRFSPKGYSPVDNIARPQTQHWLVSDHMATIRCSAAFNGVARPN